MPLTQSTSNALLNLYFRREAYATSNLFLGLLDASGAELSGSGYSRVAVSSAFGTPSDGAVSNTAQITFPAASATWQSTFVSIFNASSGGQALATIKWQIMTLSGQQLVFEPAAIKIHFGNIPNEQYFNGFEEDHINWRFTGPDVWSNYEHLRGKKLPVVERVETITNFGNNFIGGVLLPDGRVFCVPISNTTKAIVYDPELNSKTEVNTGNGYIGGVLLQDGRVFCVPHNVSSAAIFNPATNAVSFVEGFGGGSARYVGGVLLPDGRVFCVPYNHPSAAVYNPIDNSVSFKELNFSGTDKYWGGVLLPDGRAFCVPHHATQAAIYNPVTDVISYSTSFPNSTNKYTGGVLLPNGRVFCIPRSATAAPIYDPVTDTISYSASFPVANDKYAGGVLLPDGRVFCTPRSASSAAIYDYVTNSISYVSGFANSAIRHEGAVLLKDGRVFCIPNFQTSAVIYGSARGYTLPDARVLSAYDNKL